MLMAANARIAQPRIEKTTANGNGRRGALSRDEVAALIEITAQEMLGVSGDEALARLDSGELDGTVAGGTLQSLRWLLNQ